MHFVVLDANGKEKVDISGDADTVDGIHAAASATADKLLALNGDSKLPASITGDADTVDGIHAAAAAASNKLLALNDDARLPASITGDAHTVDGYHAANTPQASKVLAMSADPPKFPAHTVAGTLTVEGGLNVGTTGAPTGMLYLAGGTHAEVKLEGSSSARFRAGDTGATTNRRNYEWQSIGDVFTINLLNDAWSAFVLQDIMKVIHDGGVFMPHLKSGANQGAAGAAANELWVDTGDQTIKLGT